MWLERLERLERLRKPVISRAEGVCPFSFVADVAAFLGYCYIYVFLKILVKYIYRVTRKSLHILPRTSQKLCKIKGPGDISGANTATSLAVATDVSKHKGGRNKGCIAHL